MEILIKVYVIGVALVAAGIVAAVALLQSRGIDISELDSDLEMQMSDYVIIILLWPLLLPIVAWVMMEENSNKP